ncbi:MAG: glycosyltransferase family 39 protein [Pseudolabrys sp.]
MLLALAAYVVLWTVYATIAKGSQGLHYDMTEVIAWSRDVGLGYLKHPPLAAWIVAGWFAVLPVAEWSYYLLAMLMPAIALWIAWRLSADYLDIEKRVVRSGAADADPVFQFSCVEVQRQHRADAGVGGDDVLFPALVPDAQHALRRTRRPRVPLAACSANTGRCFCLRD